MSDVDLYLQQDELDSEIDNFLEHFGVKGMHWGIRGTRRTQKILDRHNRIATRKASLGDKLLGYNRGVFTRKGANRVLQRGANNQAKIMQGKMRVANRIAIIGGVRTKDLDFHKQGDAKAKLDRGQKVAIGITIGALGAVTLPTIASKLYESRAIPRLADRFGM